MEGSIFRDARDEASPDSRDVTDRTCKGCMDAVERVSAGHRRESKVG